MALGISAVTLHNGSVDVLLAINVHILANRILFASYPARYSAR